MRKFFILLIIAVLFVISGRNLKAQTYCTTGLYAYDCTSGYYFSSFNFGTISQNSLTCTPGNYGYNDFTNLVTSLIPGTTYPISATIVYPNPTYAKMWIDFNNDGTFDTISELIYSSPQLSLTLSDNITIPATAIPGSHRMRIRLVYGWSVFDACGGTSNSNTIGFGTVNDYTVNIASTGIPYLSVSPAFYNFYYTAFGSSSAPQQLIVNGGNLNNSTFNNVTVTAPNGFLVSLSSGSGYTNSVTIPYTGSTLASTPVYVKLVPTSANAVYSANLTITGGGATSNVALKGTSQLSYCVSYSLNSSGGSSYVYQNITRVRLGSLDNSTDCWTIATDPGSILNQYGNYTISIPAPDLKATLTYPLVLETSICGSSSNTNAVGVWIDYNHNGIFDSLYYNGVWYNEMAYRNPISLSGYHLDSVNITIPPTAVGGPTLMRVVSSYQYYPYNVFPCGTYNFGETEDYTVNIIPASNCVAPNTQPTAFIFTPNYTSISGSFTPSSDADHYLIVRSTSASLSSMPIDGHLYNALDNLGGGVVVSYQTSTSFVDYNINYGTQYYYFVFATNSNCIAGPLYLTANALAQTASTMSPGSYHSVATGNWSDPNTWSTGTVPDANSLVYIDSTFTVNVDAATNTCYNLTINNGGHLDALGQIGVLNIQNDLVNNGTLNLYISLYNYHSKLNFFGNYSSSYTGTGNNNIYNLTLTKTVQGAVTPNSPTLDINLSNLLVRESNIDTNGFVRAGLNYGIIKFSGNFNLTTNLFDTAVYNIPEYSGYWFNSPNLTIRGQSSNITMNGLLHMSQGTYNIGKLVNHSLQLNAGSTFIIDGGNINATGRIYSSAAGTFNMSGGTMTVSTVGNTNTTGSFDYLGGSTTSPKSFTMTGGKIIVQNPSTAAVHVDVRFPLTSGVSNVFVTGGTIQLGNANSPATAQTYLVDGQLWDITVDTITAKHNVALFNSAIMHDFVNPGNGIFTLGSGVTGQTLKIYGNLITNGSIIGAPSTTASLQFLGTTAQTFNVGATSQIANVIINNPLGVIANNNPLQFNNGLTLTRGALTASNLTLGNAALGIAFTLTKGAGSLISVPTFNFSNMTVNYIYNDTTAQVTAAEIPASISGSLNLNNAKGLTLGSALSVGSLILSNGILTSSATKVLTISGTSASSVNGGSVVTFVNGPLSRAFPPSATNTGTWNYPVGTLTSGVASYNPFSIINPLTGATTPYLKITDTVGTFTGTPDGSYLISVNSERRWNAVLVSGNLTSANVAVSDTNISNKKIIGKSATINGTFTGMNCSLNQGIYTLTSVNPVTSLAGYYALGNQNSMQFLSSTTTQSNVSLITPGATNQQIIGIQVVTMGNASPLVLSQINLNTNGTTNLADISKVRLYSTGTSSSFATTNVIDSTALLGTGSYSLNPSIVTPYYLSSGTNYLWLTYDVSGSAAYNNVLDAQCLSVTIDGIPRTPSVTSPYGNRKVYLPTITNLLFQSFDSAWTIASTLTPAAWSSPQNGNNSWQRNDYTTGWGSSCCTSISTGALGSAKYARFHCGDTYPAASGDFISPTIDCSTIQGVKILEFYYNKQNIQTGEGFYIYLSTDNGITYNSTPILTLILNQAAWTKYTVVLGNLSSSQVKIKFTCIGAGGNDYGIDQVRVYNQTDPNQNYLSSGATQDVTSSIISGVANQQILSLKVATQYSQNPLNVTSFDLNTIGSNNALADIDSAKIYYTGLSNTFATSTLFGGVANPNGGININGNQSLSSTVGATDTNYFWLVYNIKPTANQFDTVDAQFNSVTISGIPYSSNVVSPAGFRIIRTPLNGIYTINNTVATNLLSGGRNYNNFTDAVNELTILGNNAPVTYNVSSGQTFSMAAPTVGSSALAITTRATSSNPIVFQKSGTGTKPVLAFTGSTGSGTTSEYGVNLINASNITFDGLKIQDIGTSTSNYVERGIGITGINNLGCSNITIQNCVIQMTKTNPTSSCIYQLKTSSETIGSSNNNHFYNDTLTSSNSGIYLTGANSLLSDSNTEVANCIFYNLGGNSTSNCYPINVSYQDGAQIHDNLFTNITSSSSSYTVYTMYLYYFSNLNIYNNKITNPLISTTGSFYGIYTGGVAGLNNIYNNEISNVTCGSSFYGMYLNVSNTPGNFNVYKNKIYGVTSTYTGFTAFEGMYVYNSNSTYISTFNIYNNLIYDLKMPNGSGSSTTSGTFGVNIASCTKPVNFFNNTIYLSYTSTIATNNCWGLYVFNGSGNANFLDMRNNIIVVKPDLTVGLRSACICTSVGAPYYPFKSTCDNNLLYGGIPSGKNLIYATITNTSNDVDQLLSAYKLRMSPREQNDVTEDVPFKMTASLYDATHLDTNNIHIKTNVISRAESHGQRITTPIAIATDFDGDIRWGEIGYTGNGSSTDIGADEFNGITTIEPVITYTNMPNSTNLFGDTLNNVSIIDLYSGVNVTTFKPRLYYKKVSNSNTYLGNDNTTNGWKFTETNDVTSPFSFILDYSKLYNGVNYMDTMMYFVIAQDTLTTPNVGGDNTLFTVAPTSTNLTAANFPANGSRSYYIPLPMQGIYYVGKGQQDSSLTSALGGFFNRVNNNLVTGNITVKVTTNLSETGNVQLNAMTTQSGMPYTLTISPVDTATAPKIISGSLSGAGLLKIASPNVIFDGAINGNGRFLQLTNTFIGSANYVIQYLAGANNCTVKNTYIHGGDSLNCTGIYTNSGYVNYLTVNNDSINNCSYGINLTGFSTAIPDSNITITNNSFGSNNLISKINSYGIYLNSVSNLNLSNNTVNVVSTSTSGSSSFPRGIYGINVTNSSITKNNINRCQFASNVSGFGCAGIELTGTNNSSNITVANNLITNLLSASAVMGTNNYVVAGIKLSSTVGGINIYHNTINMYGNTSQYFASTTAQFNTGVYLASGVTKIDLRNNIIRDSLYSSTNAGSRSFAVYSAAPKTAFTSIDYNDYYTLGTQSRLGFVSGGDTCTTLAAWQTKTAQDVHSLFVDPKFTSFSNLMPTSCPVSPVIGSGTALAVVPTDYLNVSRSPLNPTLGAYELDYAKKLTLVAALQEYYVGHTLNMNRTLDMDMNSGDMFYKFASPIVDTLTIQIRSTLAPDYAVQYEFNGYNLNNNGTITPLISLPAVLTGYRYIVINHRNSIETWSDSVDFSCLSVNYNFYSHPVSTQFPTNMFVDNANNTYNGSLIWGGDVGDLYAPNRDGIINIFDLNSIFDAINDPTGTYSAGYILEDLNGDGVVNIFDLSIVFDNLNFGASSINPFTMKK